MLKSSKIENFIDNQINRIKQNDNAAVVIDFIQEKYPQINDIKDKIPRYFLVGSVAAFIWYYGLNYMRKRDVKKLYNYQFQNLEPHYIRWIQYDPNWLELMIQLDSYSEFAPNTTKALMQFVCLYTFTEYRLRNNLNVNRYITSRLLCTKNLIHDYLITIHNCILESNIDCYQYRKQKFREFYLLLNHIKNSVEMHYETLCVLLQKKQIETLNSS